MISCTWWWLRDTGRRRLTRGAHEVPVALPMQPPRFSKQRREHRSPVPLARALCFQKRNRFFAE
jgi:hypothetical protein